MEIVMPKCEENKLSEKEAALIKKMLKRNMKAQDVHFYINLYRVKNGKGVINFGRIHEIKAGYKFSEADEASDEDVEDFLNKVNTKDGLKQLLISGRKIQFAVNGTNSYILTSEDDELEYKEKPHIDSKILITIASFANNKGGVLIFGINDSSRKVVGVSKQLLEKYKDLRHANEKILNIFDTHIEIESRIESINNDCLLIYIIKSHKKKPVVASKNEGKIKEGDIYFRYNAVSKRISFSDLQSIISDRINHKVSEILKGFLNIFESVSKNPNTIDILKHQAKKVTSDKNAIPISVNDDYILEKYPLSHDDVVKICTERYSDFRRNKKFYKILERIKRDPKLAFERKLDPRGSKTVKYFYSNDVFDFLDYYYIKS